MAQGLEAATDDELASVEILGAGYGLHWETLDADLSVPGLLAGLFGTKAYIARRAGQATSPAKSAAARANGAKGGRPRKQAKVLAPPPFAWNLRLARLLELFVMQMLGLLGPSSTAQPCRIAVSLAAFRRGPAPSTGRACERPTYRHFYCVKTA